MTERCWFNLFSLSSIPCSHQGRWIGHPDLLALVPAMRSWHWCDDHRHPTDALSPVIEDGSVVAVEEETMTIFTRINIPGSDQEWRTYQKKVKTRAIRITGAFVVETSEGPLRCNDGYLAIDARGYPYPIAADEFALIYEEAP